MTIAYANSTTSTNLGTLGGATAAMDTTGDDLIVVAVSTSTTGTLTDSQSNTWTLVGSEALYGLNLELYYCSAPTVNAAHTFSYSGSYPTVQATSYTGTAPIELDKFVTEAASATSVTLASATPWDDDHLIISAQGTRWPIGESASVDSSMTIRENNISVDGGHRGCVIADIIQTTKGAIGPQWSSASTGRRGAIMAFFFEATEEIRVSNVTAQILIVPNVILREIEDSLDFTHEPFARKIKVTNFTTQVLQSQAGVFGSLSDSMSLSDMVFQFNAIADREVPNNTLALIDTVFVASNPSMFDEVNFSQVVRSSIINQVLSQPLGIKDYVQYCFSSSWASYELESEIGFLQHASNQGALEFDIKDPISFTQDASNKRHIFEQNIAFQQVVSAGKGLSPSNQIDFSHQIDSESIFLRVVEDANFIEHAMTYYFDGGCGKKQYQRYTGEGPAGGVGPQRLTFDANMAVESVGTGDILVLRNPETDDKDRIGFNRINRETRGGELNVFADPGWAKVNTLVFTIVALADGTVPNCPDVITSLLDFFQDNLGQEIYLHDWTGTSWRGVVTTPNETAVEDADGWWTITFEFEGTASDGSVPNTSLAFADEFNSRWDRLRPVTDDIVFTQSVTVGGDIYLNVEDSLALTDDYSGSADRVLLLDDFHSGAAVNLEGTSPGTGTDTWRANQKYQDDGTMVNPTNSGAYYPFTPQQGYTYLLSVAEAVVVTYSDADNCIWGFFEGISVNDIISGSGSNGETDPTTAKAVHLLRETAGGTRNNAYRIGDASDGAASTSPWTNASLNSMPDNFADLRITLDTTSGAGGWTARWEAKSLLSPNYTEVGPVTAILDESIGAVGFSNDSGRTELSTGSITLTEIKAI